MFFAKWLKKVLRMVDKDNKIESNADQVKAPTALPTGDPLPPSLIDERKKNVRLRKFEIQVFNEDLQDDGTVQLKPEKSDRAIILEVATPEELKMALQQYRMCGQIAKIVREIDPPPSPPLQATAQVAGNAQYQALAFPNIQTRNDRPQMVVANSPTFQSSQTQPKPKPKIVTIGDMQVKYDGDKVYQRQWVKLNSAEAANFRVVNDSSNKIVSMVGKHIEAKRWVRVEETSEDNIDDAVEAILAVN
jgi:hypothetical protein